MKTAFEKRQEVEQVERSIAELDQAVADARENYRVALAAAELGEMKQADVAAARKALDAATTARAEVETIIEGKRGAVEILGERERIARRDASDETAREIFSRVENKREEMRTALETVLRIENQLSELQQEMNRTRTDGQATDWRSDHEAEQRRGVPLRIYVPLSSDTLRGVHHWLQMGKPKGKWD